MNFYNILNSFKRGFALGFSIGVKHRLLNRGKHGRKRIHRIRNNKK